LISHGSCKETDTLLVAMGARASGPFLLLSDVDALELLGFSWIVGGKSGSLGCNGFLFSNLAGGGCCGSP
jgi:hypothetical protein